MFNSNKDIEILGKKKATRIGGEGPGRHGGLTCTKATAVPRPMFRQNQSNALLCIPR